MADIDRLPQIADDSSYHRIFQQDGDGVQILEELAAHFYDQELFVPGQPDQTNFNLGQRSVVQYLMKRAAGKGA